MATTAWTTAAQAVEVPIQLTGKAPPLLVMRLQHRDVSLWLDLGSATPLILHPALLADLQTTATGRTFSSVGMEGVAHTVAVSTIAHAELGGLGFDDVTVVPDSHDEAYLKTQMPPGQGSVGAGFFAGYQLVVDYAHRRLTLIAERSPSAGRSACRGHVVPLVQDPTIDWGLVTRVGGSLGERYFVWDTGAPGLVIRKPAAASAGVDASKDHVTLAHLRLNGRDYGPQAFEVWDFPAPDGLTGFIGYDFFAAHVVCVDFPRHQLRIR